MKELTDLYPQIASRENLYSAAYMAARGRRYREKVSDFNFRLEEEVEILHKELTDKTYKHGEYCIFKIYEPKERLIAAAPFRDRVVHHALHDVIEPLLDKTFIHDSYACRKGKGTHKALERAQSFLRANRFCLHADVSKFFYSIDHGILKEALSKRIADEDLLWLANGIIDSARQIKKVGGGCIRDHTEGLPIGNLTSQFFANLYLHELDYFVKFRLRSRYYIRYMDDFLIFGNDKKALGQVKAKVRDFLRESLALRLHEGKSQIYDTQRGLKFLGFRIYRGYRRLTTDNVRRFRKRMKRLLRPCGARNDMVKVCDSLRCWVAHSKYAATGGLRHRLLGALTPEKLGRTLADILLDMR